MIRWLRRLLLLLVLLLIGAFVSFIVQVPTQPLTEHVQADAIVVLTGSNGRVEEGLIALARGDAPVLLISGVGEHTTKRQILLGHATPDIRAAIERRDGEIVLDYVASTTRSNADQAAEFARERHLLSLILVTSNYHMPRSMLEFRLQMPHVQLIADPVFPADEARKHWWQDKPTRKLVFSEFGKYLAALFLRNRPQ